MKVFRSKGPGEDAAHTAWDAMIAAGVHAAFDYASKNPERAQTAIAQLRAGEDLDPEAYAGMIGPFTAVLAEAPGMPRRFPASTDAAVVGSIAAVISGHLRRGAPDRLPAAASDMIQLSLLPYLGFAAARDRATAA
jgi:hypothetical protein